MDTGEGMALYKPQRVLRQMGYDFIESQNSIRKATHTSSSLDGTVWSPWLWRWLQYLPRTAAFKMDTGEGMALYSPQRVLR